MPYIAVDPVTYQRLERYAQAANISVDLAFIEAANEFMDLTGDLLLDMMKAKPAPLRSMTN